MYPYTDLSVFSDKKLKVSAPISVGDIVLLVTVTRR
jgi:hypothetical protein